MHHLIECHGKLGAGGCGAIVELSLYDVKLFFPAGASALASFLEKNATLHTLDLSSNSVNSVGDAGAASLASALERNETLQKLNLIGNSVGDAGAASLISIDAKLAANRAAAEGE